MCWYKIGKSTSGSVITNTYCILANLLTRRKDCDILGKRCGAPSSANGIVRLDAAEHLAITRGVSCPGVHARKVVLISK